MKVIIDSNFFINLIHTDLLPLIPRVSENLNWRFIMPNAVRHELKEKHMELLSSLSDYRISTESCKNTQFHHDNTQLAGLGKGEREAICIVDQCVDRTFKNYMILTDDKPASKKAWKLGMETLDTPEFFAIANRRGMLSKHDVIQAVETLEDHCYIIPTRQDFIDSLS